MYSESLSKTLESLGAVEGTRLSVVSDGRSYVGTLMPHHEFSAPDILILKMKSGYSRGSSPRPRSSSGRDCPSWS